MRVVQGACPRCDQTVTIVDTVIPDHNWYGITPPVQCEASDKTVEDAEQLKGRPPWAWA
jgi:hypothetical protein